MTRLQRLWAMRGAALSGLERFPVALLWLAAFVVIVNLDIAGAVELEGELIARAGAASGAAAAVATAWVLFCERRSLAAPARHGGSFLLAAVLGAAIWFWEDWGVASAPLLTAAVLAVPLAPYLEKEEDGFWGFFWALMHAGILAFLAVIIFCIGLSAILASLHYLFAVDVQSSIYGHVWSIGLGFVGPLFALALVPTKFAERDLAVPNDVFITANRILADFVAIPLLGAYALILHAYAFKILISGDVPRNQIGWMVLSFGLAAMSLRVLVHPLHTVGRRPTRLFIRHWALPLVIPLMLLAGAVGQRISQHGVTPERYSLALFAAFMGSVLLAQLHPRWRGDIRAIPGLGAAWLLLASFGPWGMLSVSGASQAGRLLDRLAAAGVLDHGRLIRPPELGGPEIRELDSAVTLLASIGQIDRLRPLFAGQPDDPFALIGRTPERHDRLSVAVREALGVHRMADRSSPDGSFRHTFETAAAVPITGYDLVVPAVSWGLPSQAVPFGDGVLIVEIAPGSVAITGTGPRTEFPTEAIVTAIATRLRDIDRAAGGVATPLFVELTAGGKRIGLLFNSAGGHIRGGAVSLRSGGVTLLLRRADWTG